MAFSATVLCMTTQPLPLTSAELQRIIEQWDTGEGVTAAVEAFAQAVPVGYGDDVPRGLFRSRCPARGRATALGQNRQVAAVAGAVRRVQQRAPGCILVAAAHQR